MHYLPPASGWWKLIPPLADLLDALQLKIGILMTKLIFPIHTLEKVTNRKPAAPQHIFDILYHQKRIDFVFHHQFFALFQFHFLIDKLR